MRENGRLFFAYKIVFVLLECEVDLIVWVNCLAYIYLKQANTL